LHAEDFERGGLDHFRDDEGAMKAKKSVLSIVYKQSGDVKLVLESALMCVFMMLGAQSTSFWTFVLSTCRPKEVVAQLLWTAANDATSEFFANCHAATAIARLIKKNNMCVQVPLTAIADAANSLPELPVGFAKSTLYSACTDLLSGHKPPEYSWEELVEQLDVCLAAARPKGPRHHASKQRLRAAVLKAAKDFGNSVKASVVRGIEGQGGVDGHERSSSICGAVPQRHTSNPSLHSSRQPHGIQKQQQPLECSVAGLLLPRDEQQHVSDAFQPDRRGTWAGFPRVGGALRPFEYTWRIPMVQRQLFGPLLGDVTPSRRDSQQANAFRDLPPGLPLHQWFERESTGRHGACYICKGKPELRDIECKAGSRGAIAVVVDEEWRDNAKTGGYWLRCKYACQGCTAKLAQQLTAV
jgi:hypothetical protein